MVLDSKLSAVVGKVPLHLLPPAFNREVAHALKHGADKYGPWNWREEGRRLLASTYIGAIRRHLDAWQDGEDIDPESGQAHLAHIAASVAILLDAQEHGTFEDDRP
tara:strand:- start:407 stop:724 length:318 start_codon:yes stop_codon:yes gene_type:complete